MENNGKPMKAKKVLGSFVRMIQMGMPQWLFCLTAGTIIGLCSYGINLVMGMILSSSLQSFQKGILSTHSILIVMLSLLLVVIVMIIGYILNVHGSMSITEKISKNLLSTWLGQAEAEADTRHSGEYLSIVTSDLSELNDFYFQGLVNVFFTPVVRGIAAIITIAVYKPVLALPAVVIGILSILVSLFYSDSIQKNTQMLRESTDKITGSFGELIKGNLTHRLQSARSYILHKFEKDNDLYLGEAVRLKKAITKVEFINKLLFSLSEIFFLGLSFWFASNSQMELHLVMLFLPMQGLVFRMFSGFGDTWNFIMKAGVSGERIYKELGVTQEERGDDKADLALQTVCEVNFQDISVRHQADIFALQNFTVHMPKGQTFALVGYSGSGKTTVLKILMQFYKATTGKVSLNQGESSEYTLRSWRNNITYLQQEPGILAKTVR